MHLAECDTPAPTIRLSHDDILARHQKHLIIIIIIILMIEIEGSATGQPTDLYYLIQIPYR